MKYANSLKYVNSFAVAEPADISQRRARELCSLLGRVNVGAKFIVVPASSAGHASAVMMESVIRNAGYRVGRITADSDFDSRTMVLLDGAVADIEDYNKCVAELKSVISGLSDCEYKRQEICFALSLLLCRLYGCEFIILEGLSGEGYSLDAICAPYELVLVPTLYSGEQSPELCCLCDAIKRGVREVVSGNQKSQIYSEISNACMLAGARLNVTAKPTLCIGETTARKASFSYAERDGYVLKSPSYALRDAAMLVIEAALAMRRDGVKMPWGSISQGLEAAIGTYCFDVLSMSPSVVVDSACGARETELLIKTFEETVEPMNSVSVCIWVDGEGALKDSLSAFDGKNIETLIVCGLDEEQVADFGFRCNKLEVCRDASACAKRVHEAAKTSPTVICMGSVAFAREIKTEFIRLMGL